MRPKITFVKKSGGLGRPLPNTDNYSGLISYEATLPTGFGSDKIKRVLSLTQAEDLGITSEDAVFKYIHYHISEFYRMQPKGVLWIMFEPEPADPTTRDWEEIATLQAFTEGQIKQIGIWDKNEFNILDTDKIQAKVDELSALKMGLSVFVGADVSGIADLSTLGDLRSQTAPNVSFCISQDGANLGSTLATTLGVSITSVGNFLGTVALSNVHESIAWVQKFRIDNGSELSVPAMANGQLVKDLTPALLDDLSGKGYLTFRRFPNLTQTFYTDSPTSVSLASDFAFIENNRTIDKAIRGIDVTVLPMLNSPLYVNPDGSIDEATIGVFKDLTEQPLNTMQSDREISQFQVIIDPEQDVLASSELMISVEIIPVGVARTLTFTIGYVTQIIQQ